MAAATGISVLSLTLFFFADVVRRVGVCAFQHALVAGAAFADGIACAEWAAAVLVAGARIDDGLPGVAVFALPPNLAPTTR